MYKNKDYTGGQMKFRKTFFFFILTSMSLMFFQNCSNFWDNINDLDDSETVYVTPSGHCYHKSDCSSIRGSSKTSMTKKEAKKNGYSQCSICKP